MSVYILHPQTVATPSYSSTILKTRNVSAPILPRYCTARPLTVVGRQSLRTVIPVQDVQRSAKNSVLQQPIEELLGLEASGEHTVRKRERLNHLTAEEKQNRRKLKNRVAAQTARDRKKYRASKLEEAVRMLILENSKLREENKCLKKTCEELKNQNVELQNLLNNNQERDESCSETEEIIGEICAADGADSTLQDVGGTTLEFERFCSKILSEIDDTTAASDAAKTKYPEKCNTHRVDCTTPDIIIAPEYLKPDPEPQTPISLCTDTAINNAVEYEESASCVNFNMESDHESNCEQLSGYSFCASKSSDTAEHFTPSSPSFILFDDIKEGNNDTPSLLISGNDPMFCVPHKWDTDDDYM